MIALEVLLMEGYTVTVPVPDKAEALREAQTIAVVGLTCRRGNCLTHWPPHQVRPIRWTAGTTHIPEALPVRLGPSF